MSVKVRAKNPSSALQTLECDANGSLNLHLKSVGSSLGNNVGVSDTTTHTKLDTLETTANAIETALGGTLTVSDSTAQSSLSTIAGDTTSLDGKIVQGYSTVSSGGSGLPQFLCMGKDSLGNLDPLNVDTSGHLKITIQDIESGITNSINVSDSTAQATLSQIETAVETLDDIVLTDGSGYTASSSKGVMLLAKDSSGNFKPVELNSSSELKVTTAASGSETFEVHTSSHSAVSAGASVTSSVETLTKRNSQVGFFIKAGSSRQPTNVKIEVSPDNTNFTELSAGGGFLFTLDGSDYKAAVNAEIPYPYVRVSLTQDSGGSGDIDIIITH